MVFKNVKKIKESLPEVLHIAMFYNNGTVFQTTFEDQINVPKLGENLSEMLDHIRKIYDICHFQLENYSKLIFETDDISVIVLKLGEDSNVALFFEKKQHFDRKIRTIRQYLEQIEDLIDMDKKDIIAQEIAVMEDNLRSINEDLERKEKELRQKEKDLEQKEENKAKVILKECDLLKEQFNKLKQEESKKLEEIQQLKDKIDKI